MSDEKQHRRGGATEGDPMDHKKPQPANVFELVAQDPTIDVDKLHIKILVLVKNKADMQSSATYLNRRGWKCIITNNIKEAFKSAATFNPDLVLVSVNVQHSRIEQLPIVITQSFKIPVMIFGESTDTLTMKLMQSINASYKLHGSVSGPNIHRRIKQILQQNTKSAETQTDASKSGDGENSQHDIHIRDGRKQSDSTYRFEVDAGKKKNDGDVLRFSRDGENIKTPGMITNSEDEELNSLWSKKPRRKKGRGAAGENSETEEDLLLLKDKRRRGKTSSTEYNEEESDSQFLLSDEERSRKGADIGEMANRESANGFDGGSGIEGNNGIMGSHSSNNELDNDYYDRKTNQKDGESLAQSDNTDDGRQWGLSESDLENERWGNGKSPGNKRKRGETGQGDEGDELANDLNGEMEGSRANGYNAQQQEDQSGDRRSDISEAPDGEQSCEGQNGNNSDFGARGEEKGRGRSGNRNSHESQEDIQRNERVEHHRVHGTANGDFQGANGNDVGSTQLAYSGKLNIERLCRDVFSEIVARKKGKGQKLDDIREVVVVTLSDENESGYLLLLHAQGLNYLEAFAEKFKNKMLGMAAGYKYDIKISDYFTALVNARGLNEKIEGEIFTLSLMTIEGEVAVKFLSANAHAPEASTIQGHDKLKISLADLVPGQPPGVDVYAYLKLNAKYYRLLSPRSAFTSEQIGRLTKSKTDLFIEKSSHEKYVQNQQRNHAVAQVFPPQESGKKAVA